ncbi:GDSL esterase/lipase 5 [Striga hermonthica]|uniref:GDSL esterase/lipase 5 n=1 Tax=Striga hermonthica TaxID=68872 RepID=A0A9N7NBM5_STRHE|nr:GDSL esterase/lipase 5 [Striga hermonthica]
MVNFGSSDYTSPFLANDLKFLNSFAEQDYVNMVIGNISTLIEEIINIGGSTFVITNVGHLGCLPGLRRSKNAKKNEQGCFKKVSDLSKMHNDALGQWLSNFTSTNRANILLYDFASDISKMTEHPRDYGTYVHTLMK